jgi:hypothetical protein
MSARGWIAATAGTAFIIFVLPYVLAVFGLTPNGTETLLLVVLLWATSWALGRRGSPKAGTSPKQP